MKKNRYIILLGILINLNYSVQCQNNSKNLTVNSKGFNLKKDTNQLYFPIQLLIDTVNFSKFDKDSFNFQKRIESTQFVNIWFSSQLLALNEPILFKDYDFESYRFTWLRSFDNPISIRIEKRYDIYYLFVKKSNGAGGYSPGEIVQNDTIRVTESQWNEVKDKVYNCNVWKIPTVEKSNKIVGDGAMWIFEAKNDKNYNMVYRQTDKGLEIKELCLMLLNMSGLKIRKSNIY